ncbi:MAG: autotransporter outer membrane beta-barrel domain-containing protein [Parvibaculales bacterium]
MIAGFLVGSAYAAVPSQSDLTEDDDTFILGIANLLTETLTISDGAELDFKGGADSLSGGSGSITITGGILKFGAGADRLTLDAGFTLNLEAGNSAGGKIEFGSGDDVFVNNFVVGGAKGEINFGAGNDRLENRGTSLGVSDGTKILKIEFGIGDDVFINAAKSYASLEFGAGNDRLVNSDLIDVSDPDGLGKKIDFGDDDDVFINEAGGIVKLSGLSIIFGKGNDRLENAGANFGTETPSELLKVEFGVGNDVFLNTGTSYASLEFGDGDDRLVNSGTIHISEAGSLGKVLSFGKGDDVFINELGGLVLLVGVPLTFGEGRDRFYNRGTLNLFAAISDITAVGSSVGINWDDLEIFTNSGTIGIQLTGEAPVTPRARYRLLSLDVGAIGDIDSLITSITINNSDLTALQISDAQYLPIIDKVTATDGTVRLREYIIVQQKDALLAAPARVYDVAAKASFDCSTALVCKGINTDFTSATLDSATISLDANGFAVASGHIYFVKPSGFLLSAISQDISAKVQIDGVVYVGDVSLVEIKDADEAVIGYKLAYGSGTNHGFASLGGDGSFEILNYGGIIASGQFGAMAFRDADSVKIYNEGSIQTVHAAVSFINETTGVFEITNKGGIRAGGEAIYVDGGVVTIDNEGSISSSILSDGYVLSPSAINATISVDSNLNRSGALAIINRKKGRITYTVGNSYSGTERAGAAVFVNRRSSARLYNEGLIVGGAKRNVPSVLLTAHGIIWQGVAGAIANRGEVHGWDGAVKITNSGNTAFTLSIHNDGLIRGYKGYGIEIADRSEVRITNYVGGVITSDDNYAIYAPGYRGVYINNFGRITSKGETAVYLSQSANTDLSSDETVVYNLGEIFGWKMGVYVEGSGYILNKDAGAVIDGHDSDGVHIGVGKTRIDSDNNNLRDILYVYNSGQISGGRHGIHYAANTNISLFVDNVGQVLGDDSGIAVRGGSSSTGGFGKSKVDIINREGAGIYGFKNGIHIASLGDGATPAIEAEKIIIHNHGSILGGSRGILIEEVTEFLEIINSPLGVIAANGANGVAIDINAAGGKGGNSGRDQYFINNQGRILSDGIAYRDKGIGQFQNTGFVFGDIVIIGDQARLTNQIDADNDFTKDVMNVSIKSGSYNHSYGYQALSENIRSGVIVGNIYFFDNSNGIIDPASDGADQWFNNGGIVYGNVYFGKGNGDYRHHAGGKVHGIIHSQGNVDMVGVSGRMVINLSHNSEIEGYRLKYSGNLNILASNGRNGERTVLNIDGPMASGIYTLNSGSYGQIYIGNINMRDVLFPSKPLFDMGDGFVNFDLETFLGVNFRFDRDTMNYLRVPPTEARVHLLAINDPIHFVWQFYDFGSAGIKKPVIMDIDFEVIEHGDFIHIRGIYMTYKGLDFTNAGRLPNAPEDASRFADYLERLFEAEETFFIPASASLLATFFNIDEVDEYIALLEEALGTANYDSLLSDLSEISGVSGFVDDFTSANCAVRDKAYQSLVVSFEESGCSWTSFAEQSLGDRDEQVITSGRQSPLGEHWVSMVAAQYKKVELVDRVEGHARNSETYLLGAGLRSRTPIANVAEVSASLTMGRGEHRRNREWASIQQASLPEMNFQMVRIGARRSFALPLKGSWKITPSTDFTIVRIDISDLQHEGGTGDSVFAVDDMEHNRQSVRAGIEFSGEYESQRGSSITAFAKVGVEHYVNGRSAAYTIRLIGANEGFTYYGRAIDENVLTTSLGFTAKRGKVVTMRVFYEGKQGIGGVYENHEAKLEFLKRF